MSLILKLQSLSTRIGEEIKVLRSQKQDKLVSGTSLKTVNGQSLLGEGDVGVVSTSDSRLSDDRNPVDQSVSYGKVASSLTSSVTVSLTVDLSASGIGRITMTGSYALTFTNFELNKTYLLIMTANSYTASFAQSNKHIMVAGNALITTSGVYYISLTCVDDTPGAEKLLTVIMKAA